MGVFGVQAGPGVTVVDPANPDNAADVTPPAQSQDGKTSGLVTVAGGFDQQTGVYRPQAENAGGRLVLSDTDKWTLILVEMRLQSLLLAEIAAGRTVADDLDVLRSSLADPDLVNTLS